MSRFILVSGKARVVVVGAIWDAVPGVLNVWPSCFPLSATDHP